MYLLTLDCQQMYMNWLISLLTLTVSQPGQIKMQHRLPPWPTLLGYAQIPDKENPEMDINKLFHPGKSTNLFDKRNRKSCSAIS